LQPHIFSVSVVIIIIIAYPYTFVLVFCMLCVLFGKHTFIAFENVSAQSICNLVLPESIDTYAIYISPFILKTYIRHYFYPFFLNKPVCWQGERFLVEDFFFFLILSSFS